MKWSPECETSQRNKVSSDRWETPQCTEGDGGVQVKERRLKEEEERRRRRKQMEKLNTLAGVVLSRYALERKVMTEAPVEKHQSYLERTPQ